MARRQVWFYLCLYFSFYQVGFGKPKANNKCFDAEPVSGLFTFTFFNWAWQELNRTASDLYNGTTCGRFWYEHAPAPPGESELVFLDHRYPQSESNFVVSGNATVKDDKWTVDVTFPKDTLPSTYKVLGIVELSYALVYSCVEESSGVKERAWVLSRHNLSDTYYQEKMDKVIENISGLRDRLKDMEMKSCDELIEENDTHKVLISFAARDLWSLQFPD